MNKTSLYLLKTKAIIKQRIVFVITLASGFVLLSIIYCPSFRWEFPEMVWTLINPVVGILTLSTAIYIYWMQAKKQWEDSLEKRLDINYEFENNNIVVIKGAYLASEGDIRNWAQSLGNQILGQLDFEMNWLEKKPVIFFDPKLKVFIKKYEVTIYLTSYPTKDSNEKIPKFLSRKLKHSQITGSIDKLPITWSRINNNVK